jgi:hypothetical protein
VLPVFNAGRDLLFRSPIAGKLVGDHHARRPALPLQQLAQEPFGGPFVPPALHQDVEHDALLVHRAPHPVFLASNFDGNLVQVPFVSGAGQPTPRLAKFWPNLSADCRMVLWLTMMPRAASISSTMRRLSGKRKYSQTAWLMTSAGKRWPA